MVKPSASSASRYQVATSSTLAAASHQPLAGSSRPSAGVAPGNTGKPSGTASRIVPHSVSVVPPPGGAWDPAGRSQRPSWAPGPRLEAGPRSGPAWARGGRRRGERGRGRAGAADGAGPRTRRARRRGARSAREARSGGDRSGQVQSPAMVSPRTEKGPSPPQRRGSFRWVTGLPRARWPGRRLPSQEPPPFDRLVSPQADGRACATRPPPRSRAGGRGSRSSPARPPPAAGGARGRRGGPVVDQVRVHAVETRVPPVWLRLRHREFRWRRGAPPIQSTRPPPA